MIKVTKMTKGRIMNNSLLNTDLFILRKPNKEDAVEILAINKDWSVMEYYGVPTCTNLDEAKNELQWFESLFSHNSGRWVIADSITNKYIGDIGLFNYDETHNRAEIGYKLCKDYWQKGIMSKCMQAVLRVGFEDYNYNRIEAMVDERNNACIALLKKNGFTKEGLFREYEFEHGHYVNLKMYSILKREFNI